MSILILTAAALIAGQTAPAPRSGSDLTRDLNTLPASAVGTPAPQSARQGASPPDPAPAPAPTRPAVSQPASARPAAVQATAAPTPGPSASTAAPQAQTRPAPASAAPVALNAAARARLPFTVDLPAGVELVVAHEGSDASVYRLRKGPVTLAMIYAGPASQFPIYDGQMVQAGGRATIIVPEGARRVAMEHLFQRATAPREVHVWVASVDGANRDLAETVAQSVDVR